MHDEQSLSVEYVLNPLGTYVIAIGYCTNGLGGEHIQDD